MSFLVGYSWSRIDDWRCIYGLVFCGVLLFYGAGASQEGFVILA